MFKNNKKNNRTTFRDEKLHGNEIRLIHCKLKETVLPTF